MNLNFSLARPNNPVSAIRGTIYHKGERYRFNIGISIDPKTWSQDNQKCSKVDIQKRITKIRHFIEDSLTDLSTEADIKYVIAHIQDGDIEELPSCIDLSFPTFWQYFLQWSEKPSVVKKQRGLIYRTVKRLMGDKENWNGIDERYYFRLIEKLNEEKYSKNYQATIVAKIKVVMSEGYKLGYHTNTAYHSFKKPSAEVDSVYLTEEELERIYNVELFSEVEQKCRDLLILGCYTGARWEDFSQFTKANIQGSQFRYIQHKTGARVIIPLSPKIKPILARYGGKSPKLGPEQFNKVVKTICERAGVNEMVEIRHSKGNFYEHETLPKFKLISSHCCRRTLCTLLAQKGVPISSIMQVSGHKNLSSLQKYLRQTISETADKLAELDYFK